MSKPLTKPIPKRFRGTAIVCYSDNGLYYYVKNYAGPFGFWLSTTTYPTPEETPKHEFKGGVQIVKDDGTTYCRELLPFNFWKVRSYDHREETLPMKSDLVLDYFAARAQREERVAA